MTAVESLFQGIVQGLTEFIPVSSSGHEVLLMNLFSGASDHLFLEFVNVGTLLALVVFFRHKIWAILTDVFRHRNYKLARNLIITSVPAGAVGFLLAGFIGENGFFGSALTVVFAMIIIGVLMLIIERLPHASPVRDGTNLSPCRALAIGLAQVCSLVPGVSRSGSTIIAGRLAGLPAAQSAEYSFLASIPIMFGVSIKVLIGDHAYLVENLPTLVLSNVAAFIAGMLAIGFMLKYLAQHDLKIFGVYRIALATIVLIWLI